MEIETDRYGVPIMGENDDGYWWGTPDLPATIEDYDDGWLPTRKRRYYLNGYWFGQNFDAFVRASSMRRVEDYFRGIGVKDVTVQRGFP